VGHVWVDAVIGNPFTGRSVSARALVDTGATYSVIPRRVFEELKLPVIGRRIVVTARGSVELDECLGVVEVMGRRAYSHILVSEDIDTPLIGTVTLETLGFEVDPITGRLKEAKIFLL
jgi:aspartyl protease family protein